MLGGRTLAWVLCVCQPLPNPFDVRNATSLVPLQPTKCCWTFYPVKLQVGSCSTSSPQPVSSTQTGVSKRKKATKYAGCTQVRWIHGISLPFDSQLQNQSSFADSATWGNMLTGNATTCTCQVETPFPSSSISWRLLRQPRSSNRKHHLQYSGRSSTRVFIVPRWCLFVLNIKFAFKWEGWEKNGQLWREAGKGKEKTEQYYKGTPNHTLPTCSELKSLLLSSLCRADKGFPMPPGYRVRRVLFFKHPYQNELYFNCNVLLQPEISRS